MICSHQMFGYIDGIFMEPSKCHDPKKMDREFLLRMSYMEIYNEEINDLLDLEHWRLQIHESLERGIYVAGLKEEIVTSPEQVLKLVEFGESHRHIGETNMNLYSSRSHTIFRMIVESRDRSVGDHSFNCFDAVRVSALNLVNLAGSEQAGKPGAEGMRLKEGSHINKSLMALGTVIKKLSDGVESLGGHVPYRDSKLTRILQPALGGNANTTMICNITLSQVITSCGNQDNDSRKGKGNEKATVTSNRNSFLFSKLRNAIKWVNTALNTGEQYPCHLNRVPHIITRRFPPRITPRPSYHSTTF